MSASPQRLPQGMKNLTRARRRKKKEMCRFQVPPVFINFGTDEYNLNIFTNADQLLVFEAPALWY
jgi:hypothetical protein